MSRDIDPNAAIDYIIKTAPEYAAAKAGRVYIENFLRSKKSLLMQSSGEAQISAQERDAYAHPEYAELVDGLREAVEKEEALRWKLTAAQLRVEVWRSMERTSREQDKAVR